MTSPPESLKVESPGCGHLYFDWYRPPVNLSLDDFDDDFLEEVSTTTRPERGIRHNLDALFAWRSENGRRL